jgi:Domain of unknown function (DUF4158)
MTQRQLLSPQARAALFDPPTDVRAIVRHYTFSNDDVTLIRQRRRNANRLGLCCASRLPAISRAGAWPEIRPIPAAPTGGHRKPSAIASPQERTYACLSRNPLPGLGPHPGHLFTEVYQPAHSCPKQVFSWTAFWGQKDPHQKPHAENAPANAISSEFSAVSGWPMSS